MANNFPKKTAVESVASIVSADNSNVNVPDIVRNQNAGAAKAAEGNPYKSSTELIEHLNMEEDDVAANFLNNNNLIGDSNVDDVIKQHVTPMQEAENPGLMDRLKGIIGSQLDFGKDKLSVKEMFPNIDTNIKAGTYSGRIIGTHNVYIGEGTVIPMSILQNRNLAQKEAAKQRVKIAKKVRAATNVNAPEQMQSEMDEITNDLLDEANDKVKGKTHALANSNNPEARWFHREKQKITSLNRNLWNFDKSADKIMTKDFNDPSKYVAPEAVFNALEIRRGSLDLKKLLSSPAEMEKWLSKGAKLISYENMMKVMDSHMIKHVEKDAQNFINGEFKDIETNADLRNAYIRLSTSKTHQERIAAVKKFVSMDRVEAIVDPILANSNVFQGYDKEEKALRRQQAIDYYYNQLGTEIVAKSTMGRIAADPKTSKSGGSGSKLGTLYSDLAKNLKNQETTTSVQDEFVVAQTTYNSNIQKAKAIKDAGKQKQAIADADKAYDAALVQTIKTKYDIGASINANTGVLEGEFNVLANDKREAELRVGKAEFEYSSGNYLSADDFLAKVETDVLGGKTITGRQKMVVSVLSQGKVSSDDTLTAADITTAKDNMSKEIGDAFDAGQNGKGVVSSQKVMWKHGDKWLTAKDLKANPSLMNLAKPMSVVTYRPMMKNFAFDEKSPTKSTLEEHAWVRNKNMPAVRQVFDLSEPASVAALDAINNSQVINYRKASEGFTEGDDEQTPVTEEKEVTMKVE